MNKEELENENGKFVFKDYLAQKDKYLEWARNRVLVLNTDEFNKWMIKERGLQFLVQQLGL